MHNNIKYIMLRDRKYRYKLTTTRVKSSMYSIILLDLQVCNYGVLNKLL